MGVFNSVWKIIKPNPKTLVVFLILFGLTSYLQIRIISCFHGGTNYGFPKVFYLQCYSDLSLEGPRTLGPATFSLGSFIFDLIFWYLISVFLVFLFRKLIRRLASRNFSEGW